MHQNPQRDHQKVQNPESSESESTGKTLSPPPFQLKVSGGALPPPVQRKESNNSLPSDLVDGFANQSGHDLGDVKVHRNSDKPAQVGALAFAQGNEIHLGAGQEKHLPHEAAHIIQQREGRVKPTTEIGGVAVNDNPALEKEADQMGEIAQRKSAGGEQVSNKIGTAEKGATQLKASDETAQLLVKDQYPWTGVIIRAASAALRSQPRKDPARPHEGTIADVPRGTNVTVTARTGNWLNVSVTINGRALTGYISQELVDDAVAASMTSLVGEEATWVPSGPGSGNTFETWASAATEAAAPAIEASTTINCWEMVLYAAYRAHVIDWAWIHDLYVNQDPATWVTAMSRSTAAYVPGTSRMQRGDLVFFDGISHVAMATGSGDQILSFWPPPDKASVSNTVDQVKTTTVQELVDYMTPIWGAPPVTFGPGAW